MFQDFWTGNFAEGEYLPIEFSLDGRTYSGIHPEWNVTIEWRRIDANIIETVYRGEDPNSGLRIRVEVLTYQDYPVAEWTAYLTNEGDGPTPIISDLGAFAEGVNAPSASLWSCNGDFWSAEGYTPTQTPLTPGDAMSYAPSGGRPCDRAFPYFRLQSPDHGYAIAIGWPGQWRASFTQRGDFVDIRAGQEATRFRLRPGEMARTPRVAVLAYAGGEQRGINLWRRWYRAHVLPRADGSPLAPALAAAGVDGGEEFTSATEANQIAFQEKFHALGIDFDIWWIDAGWYECVPRGDKFLWWQTGTWAPDPARFPNGIAPVSANAAKHGARQLVWFEPERVTPETQIARDHPEWLLRLDGESDALLNLGIPECREWLTRHVGSMIWRDGIGVYRQDFNFPPLEYWRSADKDDRQGMAENLHVQGYLRYWDDLLANHPGLWIDSCASGGRRNDLETMRRSVPLHYTDWGYGDHPVKLAFHHTLHQWLPYFKEVTLSWDQLSEGEDGRFNKVVDRFSFHCAMASMLALGLDIRHDDYDYDLGREMIALWRRIAPILLHGDYYPLTPHSAASDRWFARQFDRPESGDGFVQAIRHKDCPEAGFVARLNGLEQEAVYALQNPETAESFRSTGRDLAESGIRFTLPPREGAIFTYQRIERAPSGI